MRAEFERIRVSLRLISVYIIRLKFKDPYSADPRSLTYRRDFFKA